MKSKIEVGLSKIKMLDWLPPLLARISVGLVFVQSGWGKLNNIDQVADYFTSLGIPFANFQAPFVAGLEFVGGLLLILGLLTRLISLPLLSIMIVAIIFAKRDEINVFSDIFGFSEFLFIIIFIWLFIGGAGSISFDKIISPSLKGNI